MAYDAHCSYKDIFHMWAYLMPVGTISIHVPQNFWLSSMGKSTSLMVLIDCHSESVWVTIHVLSYVCVHVITAEALKICLKPTGLANCTL